MRLEEIRKFNQTRKDEEKARKDKFPTNKIFTLGRKGSPSGNKIVPYDFDKKVTIYPDPSQLKDLATLRGMPHMTQEEYDKYFSEAPIIFINKTAENPYMQYEYNVPRRTASGKIIQVPEVVSDPYNNPINCSNSVYTDLKTRAALIYTYYTVIDLRPHLVRDRERSTDNNTVYKWQLFKKRLLRVNPNCNFIIESVMPVERELGSIFGAMFYMKRDLNNDKSSTIGNPAYIPGSSQMYKLLSKEQMYSLFTIPEIKKDGQVIVPSDYNLVEFDYAKEFPDPSDEAVALRHGIQFNSNGSLDSALGLTPTQHSTINSLFTGNESQMKSVEAPAEPPPLSALASMFSTMASPDVSEGELARQQATKPSSMPEPIQASPDSSSDLLMGQLQSIAMEDNKQPSSKKSDTSLTPDAETLLGAIDLSGLDVPF